MVFLRNAMTILMKVQKETAIMKPKPDDRSDNARKIQHNIDKTIHNYRLATDMIEKTDDEKMKQALEQKNDRRKTALNSMRVEIKDEALFNKNHLE
jgi:small acid-soluble spore protein (thioredoxin-like protein)